MRSNENTRHKGYVLQWGIELADHGQTNTVGWLAKQIMRGAIIVCTTLLHYHPAAL